MDGRLDERPGAEFVLRATADGDLDVAIEACKFWLTFSSLDEEACEAGMMAAVAALFSRAAEGDGLLRQQD